MHEILTYTLTPLGKKILCTLSIGVSIGHFHGDDERASRRRRPCLAYIHGRDDPELNYFLLRDRT